MNSMNSIGKIGRRVLFTSLAAILILVGPLASGNGAGASRH